MLLILPVLVILLLYLVYYGKGQGMTEALANTWLSFVLFVWLVTEGLSLIKAWTSISVIFFWSLFLLGLTVVFLKRDYRKRLEQRVIQGGGVKQVCRENKKLIMILSAFWLFILVTAMLSSQNNIDSMKYHLPRIMHWIQNKSVWYYATDVDLQVRYPSLTEYLVSQIFMLCNNDRMANLVQTGAYLLSGIMVYGIARKLGVSYRFSFLALAVYHMMPMAIAQCYTTQTDIVAGMFLLVYIFFILDFIRADHLKMDGRGFICGGRLAACIFLGYLCKPTICFVMVVFFLWMCMVRIYRKDRVHVLIRYVLVGGVVAVMLYLPLFAKSYQTYHMKEAPAIMQGQKEIGMVVNIGNREMSAGQDEGNPSEFLKRAGNALAPDSANIMNAIESPSRFVITCMENLGRNSSSICFPKWNELIEKVVCKAAVLLGYETEGFKVQEENKNFFHRDMASNPTVMLCMVLACICVIARLTKIGREQFAYGICAVVGFVVQCGLMGYTPFRTRYLVGAMAVMCPFFAIVLENLRIEWDKKKAAVFTLLMIAGIGAVNTFSYAMENIIDGFRGNGLHQYFEVNLQEHSYQQIIDFINNNKYRSIGLGGYISLEYVFWQEIDDVKRMEYVNVSDPFLAKYEDQTYVPDCILAEGVKEATLGDRIQCHGNNYQCALAVQGYGGDYVVYIRDDAVLNR